MLIFVCNHVCVCLCVCLYICILTVRDTLILDLQVLVCSWTGVWEDVDPCNHHTLSPVVTPGEQGRADGWRDGGISKKDDGVREEEKKEGRGRESD